MSLTLKIEQDEDALDPRKDHDNLGKMVFFHKRYTLGDYHTFNHNDFGGWKGLSAHLRKTQGAEVILPVFMLDHSGVTISTKAFNDRWDSGMIGFIYMDRETILREAPNKPKNLSRKAKQWAEAYLVTEVETYNQYLTGDVWGYVITDEETNEVVESCWGFFGHDYCQEEGEDRLAALEKAALEKTFNQPKPPNQPKPLNNEGDFFVMLTTHGGRYTPLMDESGEEIAKFDTAELARTCARDNPLGENFGYEIFEIGDGWQ